MPPITSEQFDALMPFITGGVPDETGELDLYCPLHNDSRRSASLNVMKGVWFCHGGCGGGSVRQLVQSNDCWVPPDGRVKDLRASTAQRRVEHKPTVQDARVWHKRLMSDRAAMRVLARRRGILRDTMIKARLGWDGRLYRIPVFSPERKLWNVRSYDMWPNNGRSKIWSVRGMGRARLYPSSILERAQPGDAVLLCEGEWDALLALQTGYLAVTRTDGAGKPWRPEWDIGFAGLRVYCCHDADVAGRTSDEITAKGLAGVAESIHFCRLPYEPVEKHGPDLTDYLLEAEDRELALGRLLVDAQRIV